MVLRDTRKHARNLRSIIFLTKILILTLARKQFLNMPQESPFSIQNKSGRASIKIIGAIDWWENDSKSFTRMIDDLIKAGIKDVDGYLNSPGGQMFEGNEIANQIRRFEGERIVTLGALVASSGTTVSLAFKKIIASKNTQYMIHDPLLYTKIEHLEDYDSSKKMYENLRNQAIEEYADKTKLDKSEISDMMRATTWMNATEAKAKGFIDEVLETKAEMPANALESLTKMKMNIPDSVRIEMMTSLPKNENENEKSDMKKVLLHLGLPENATEDQVIEVINSKDAIATNAITSYGKSKGLKEEDLTNLAKKAPAATLSMINGIAAQSNANTPAADPTTPTTTDPAPTTNEGLNNKIVDLLEKNLKGGLDNSSKTWDDYTAKEREELHNSNPAEFDKLFNAKYN